MSAGTRHGGGSKATKITKITKTKLVFFAVFVSFVIFVPPPWRVSVSSQAQQSEQRPPVFRAGAHYVRVDAYPTKSGKIIEGLTRDDFEVFEDGKPQSIENAEFVTFPTWTPETERRDPRTQEEGYQLAGDASYRVFAVVIDREAFDMVGWNLMHRPLIDFLERTLGPKDLFGLLHTKNEWRDLVLGQKTTTARIDLSKREWWTTREEYDDLEWALVSCGLERLVPLSRADRTYSLLEGLVHLLGAIREERKSIVYVADGLPSAADGRASGTSGMPELPRVGVTPGGRLGPVPRDVVGGGGSSSAYCNEERMRLAAVDFGERFRELLKLARTANVAFYPISPKGLQGIEFTREGRADLAGFRRGQRGLDSLLSLASETDGVAVVNSNDLRGGLTRIAHDLQACYVLGYYTTNTTWDGGLRSIKVRLRPKRPSARPGTGETIRARRQYRAPTREEIAAISASVSPARSAAPAAASPPPPPTIVRKPVAYLVHPRAAAQPADVTHLTRTNRIRVEWEAIGALEQRTARILDRNGKPLAIEVPISEQDGRVVVELPLAAFARGEYALELTVRSGSIVERSPLAFRVQ